MIISHRLKFAFFRCPKTGSTTTEMLLRMCGVIDQDVDFVSEMKRFGLPGNDLATSHMTPAEAIDAELLTLAQAREYDMYATLRDPLARAVSAYGHGTGRIAPITNSREAYAKTVLKGKDWGLLEKRQVDYFFVDGEQVCEPLEFADFEASVRGLVASLGGIDFPTIPNFNVRQLKEAHRQNRAEFVDNNPDPQVKVKLRKKFADDIAFFESNYGPVG